MRRFSPPRLRAFLWAARASLRIRRLGPDHQLDAIDLPIMPVLSDEARSAVEAALRRTGATCLGRSIVLQRWDACHGRPRDLVIGVKRVDGNVHAHAWLVGDPDGERDDFVELHRRPAPTPASR